MNFPISELLRRNKATNPETVEAVYGSLVEKELKKEGYSVSKIQAIVNNYLAEPENPKYIAEFKELQDCRIVCKERIRGKLISK